VYRGTKARAGRFVPTAPPDTIRPWHRPWHDRERPAPFAAMLRAAKRAVDPAGILNPGVLIDP
jgi:hypothetical protein